MQFWVLIAVAVCQGALVLLVVPEESPCWILGIKAERWSLAVTPRRLLFFAAVLRPTVALAWSETSVITLIVIGWGSITPAFGHGLQLRRSRCWKGSPRDSPTGSLVAPTGNKTFGVPYWGGSEPIN